MSKALVRDLVVRSAANKPKKIAYICGERSITWGDIHARSNQLASGLQSLGHRPGDAVGILAPETIEVYEHFFACFKLGLVRTGVNRRFSSSEILHIVKGAGLKSILVHVDCLALLDSIRTVLSDLNVILIAYGGKHNLQHDYESLLANAPPLAGYPDVNPEAAAMYTFTSGTTGSPKGVVLSDRAIKTVVDHSPGCFGFSPDDIFYCPLGNSWAAVITNLLCLANGMTFVIPDKEYDTLAFLRDVERLKISACLLAPTMLQWVLDELDKQEFDIHSIRLVMYGSAPATPKLIEAVSSRFGCGMLQGYGASECAAGWIASLTPEDHIRGLKEKPQLLGSAGRAPSYFDISIRDEQGVPVPVGDVGEVWVRSDTVMSGYLNLPEQTEEVLKEGGWLITNDMGVLDDEGYLYLKDRRKFMIVTGGINVFPAHVEAVMSSHPAIEEIAVLGVPHAVWGEAVVAVVNRYEEHRSVTQEELLAYCNGKLGKVMMPKYIHFVDEPLPKSVNFKIQKHVMQQWFKDNPEWLPASFHQKS